MAFHLTPTYSLENSFVFALTPAAPDRLAAGASGEKMQINVPGKTSKNCQPGGR
jgi:hypothetical protein